MKLCPSETEIGSEVIVRLAERRQTGQTRQKRQQIQCLVFRMTSTQEWKFKTETATRTVLTLLVPTRDWYLAVPGLYLFLGCWWWCSELYSLPSQALGPRALPLCGWNYLLMISRVKGCKLRDVGFTQAPLPPPLRPLKGKTEDWVLTRHINSLDTFPHNTVSCLGRELCLPLYHQRHTTVTMYLSPVKRQPLAPVGVPLAFTDGLVYS